MGTRTTLALAVLALFAACDSPTRGREGERRVRESYVDFAFTGDAVGRVTVSGAPVYDPYGALDNTHDWVVLETGAFRDVATPRVTGNRTRSVFDAGSDLFQLFLNPSITATGVYRGDACSSPAAFGGCFEAQLWLARDLGTGDPLAGTLRSLPDSATLTLETYTADEIRGRIRGTFVFQPAHGAAGRVTGDASFHARR